MFPNNFILSIQNSLSSINFTNLIGFQHLHWPPKISLYMFTKACVKCQECLWLQTRTNQSSWRSNSNKKILHQFLTRASSWHVLQTVSDFPLMMHHEMKWTSICFSHTQFPGACSCYGLQDKNTFKSSVIHRNISTALLPQISFYLH